MKRLLSILALCALALALTACGIDQGTASGSEAGKDAPDLEGLFAELSALCGEAAVDIDPATAAGLYGAEESEIFACRAAGGVSADEVTIFQCADEKRAQEVLAITETRLSDEAESYADYLPEEAEKLRNAAAVQKGDVVAVAVCADAEKAAELMENYLG